MNRTLPELEPPAAEQVRAAIERLGAAELPDRIELELHGDRWFAFLPANQLAVFALPEGRERIARERSVLRALERRCTFAAPRILREAEDGSCDLRAMVPGVHATHAVYDRVRDDPASATQVGVALGAMIAELHAHVRLADLSVVPPAVPEWPEPRRWIQDRLPRVIDDRALVAAADRIIARFEEEGAAGPPAERVLVHTDLGLHNVSIDSTNLVVLGIFDWESACWSDRHLDFRHLVFDVPNHRLFESAIEVYEARTGHSISRKRVFLHNAAMAVSYLAFRDGIAADRPWCGRTLAEDLRWTRTAIARIEASG